MKKKFIIGLICTLAFTLSSNAITVFASDSGQATSKHVSTENVTNQSKGDNNNSDSGGTSPIAVSNIQPKKVMISKVTPDRDVIEPGKPFTLTYRIENISNGRIDGLSLKLVNVEGKNALEGFIPVGTTNEIYVGSIAYNDVKEVSITLCSDPNTKPGTYNFLNSVTYNQGGEPQEEITKVSGIMIKSTPELELASIESMGTNIMGTLINDGISKIKKVNVKVKIGNEEYEQKIGSIDSESEEYFEIPITPVESETKANITVTYEDVSGAKYSTEGSYMVQPVVTEEEPPKKSSSIGFFAFIANLFKFGE